MSKAHQIEMNTKLAAIILIEDENMSAEEAVRQVWSYYEDLQKYVKFTAGATAIGRIIRNVERAIS